MPDKPKNQVVGVFGGFGFSSPASLKSLSIGPSQVTEWTEYGHSPWFLTKAHIERWFYKTRAPHKNLQTRKFQALKVASFKCILFSSVAKQSFFVNKYLAAINEQPLKCMYANSCSGPFIPWCQEVFYLLQHSLIANKKQEVGNVLT